MQVIVRIDRINTPQITSDKETKVAMVHRTNSKILMSGIHQLHRKILRKHLATNGSRQRDHSRPLVEIMQTLKVEVQEALVDRLQIPRKDKMVKQMQKEEERDVTMINPGFNLKRRKKKRPLSWNTITLMAPVLTSISSK